MLGPKTNGKAKVIVDVTLSDALIDAERWRERRIELKAKRNIRREKGGVGDEDRKSILKLFCLRINAERVIVHFRHPPSLPAHYKVDYQIHQTIISPSNDLSPFINIGFLLIDRRKE